MEIRIRFTDEYASLPGGYVVHQTSLQHTSVTEAACFAGESGYWFLGVYRWGKDAGSGSLKWHLMNKSLLRFPAGNREEYEETLNAYVDAVYVDGDLFWVGSRPATLGEEMGEWEG